MDQGPELPHVTPMVSIHINRGIVTQDRPAPRQRNQFLSHWNRLGEDLFSPPYVGGWVNEHWGSSGSCVSTANADKEGRLDGNLEDQGERLVAVQNLAIFVFEKDPLIQVIHQDCQPCRRFS